MKKQFVYILSIMMVIGLLVGCSQKSDVSENLSDRTALEEYETAPEAAITIDLNDDEDEDEKPYPQGEIIVEDKSPTLSKIMASLPEGDFSPIVGTYQAHEEYAAGYDAECPDIVITQNGTVKGGRMIYPWEYQLVFRGTAPISVDTGGSDWGENTLLCTIEDTPGTFIEEAGIFEGQHNEFYVVYPPGISAFDGSLTEELDKVRIRYVIIDGGVTDMVYTKND